MKSKTNAGTAGKATYKSIKKFSSFVCLDCERKRHEKDASMAIGDKASPLPALMVCKWCVKRSQAHLKDYQGAFAVLVLFRAPSLLRTHPRRPKDPEDFLRWANQLSFDEIYELLEEVQGE